MPGMMKVTRGSGDGSVDIPRLRRALGTVPEYRFTITGALRLRHREVRGRHHLAEQHGECNEPTRSGKSGHRRSVALCRDRGTLCAGHRPGGGKSLGKARDIVPVGQLMVVMSVGGSTFAPGDVLHHVPRQEPVGGVTESSGNMVDELGSPAARLHEICYALLQATPIVALVTRCGKRHGQKGIGARADCGAMAADEIDHRRLVAPKVHRCSHHHGIEPGSGGACTSLALAVVTWWPQRASCSARNAAIFPVCPSFVP